MSEIDRGHAQRLMQAEGLDALVLFQPEAFRYAIGAPAGVATMWGRAGAAIALVPADPGEKLAAIASDHAAPTIARMAPEVDLRTHRIWIDQIDLGAVTSLDEINAAYPDESARTPRPETFDRDTCFALLFDLLRARGLDRARIGVDLDFMPAADFAALTKAVPSPIWTDGSLCLRRLRAVKNPGEILRLRQASAAAEAGLIRMAQAVSDGVESAALSAAWKTGAAEAAAQGGFSLSGTWDYISVGPDLNDLKARVERGALIKADVGTLVDGYSSDGARSYCFGSPSPVALSVFGALEEAFEAGVAALRPGMRFKDVHATMQAAVRRQGLSRYDRGHFGHSVGAAVGIEEWPFFSADSTEVLAPNMVVALEAPFYGQGLGALMIEDMFLITQTGAERISTLPRGLLVLG
ncbi:proline dipeptidase [Xaviernesmea oryzae]|uniref:Proline dipeptidase n=1 Tax=Xaviernesmea oryzae TaxID=464029 RepID=A0A1Q9AQQ1_9HYPH|nr:Xaa-Pro peptidase family protein [Xaviernesmea oryzae]OLP57711.1 proline dipeptidase [Xaviernesmea oryzae]SEM05299.1 Xaa-Pro aminopeptidase [Xaviernesmea oryzae]